MSTATKATHTPGPWKLTDAEDYRIRIVSPWSEKLRPETADGYGDYRGIHICAIDHQGSNPCVSEAQAEANARLIAAAPEMLEALESIVFALDTQARVDFDSCASTGRNITLREQIEDAIRKARGEQ